MAKTRNNKKGVLLEDLDSKLDLILKRINAILLKLEKELKSRS